MLPRAYAEPLKVERLASGLGAMGLFGWWRKRKIKQFPV